MKPGEANKLYLLHILQTIFGAENVTPEHIFHPVRRWRFDYAVIPAKIAVEYDGINFSGHGGRHSSLVGMTQDHEKMNQAILLGWKVFRFTKKNFDGKMTKGISTPFEILTEAKDAFKLQETTEFRLQD